MKKKGGWKAAFFSVAVAERGGAYFDVRWLLFHMPRRQRQVANVHTFAGFVIVWIVKLRVY